MVLTSEIRMKHVDRHWKAYLVGNKGKYRNLSMKQQSASDGHCYQMDKSGQCVPRGSKDYEVNQLLCEKGVPCQDERLEKGSFP